jgi:ABC-type multidrug transport system fused ATPase/permease subunit
MSRVDRFRLLFRYAGRQKGHLVALVALTVLPALMAALQPLPIKFFIDNALGGEPVTGIAGSVISTLGVSDGARSLVVVAAIAATLIAVAASLVSYSIGLYWEWVGERMVRDVSRDLFDHLQRLSPRFHSRTPAGDTLSLVTTDSSAPSTAISAVLVSPAMQVFTMLTVGLSAWYLNPGLTVVLLASTPILAVVSRRLSARLKTAAARSRRERVAVVSFVTQIVHALPVVQAFTAEPQNMQTFRSITDRSVEASRRTVSMQAAAESVTAIGGAVSAAIILVIGGNGVLQGTVTVGDLVVFLAYSRILDRQFRGLLGVGRQLRLAEVGLDRMHEILTCEDRVSDPPAPVLLPARMGGLSVRWDAVTFGYESRRPVLHDVNLTVEPGETVAILGETGAGKSTLVALASRLFDPWAGRVLLGGVDVRDASVADVRARVAVVRQEPLIVPASVADNISIARPGASRAEIEEACRKALAAEFIEDLPDGYDTILAEHGSSLSGGQRQRLAIARAYLKDAPVLVLDEPTSALDTESEALFVRSLQKVSEGRTVLVIAHRLSTVRRADRAIVLDRGRIVEEGTRSELVRRDGVYARFHRLQMIGASP